MMDLAELTWGRYNSNQVAPIGSYVNLRTLCIFQQTADGNVPADGTFHRVAPLGTESNGAIATIINNVLGTAYVGGSFHTCAGGDNVTSAGQASDDA